MLNKLRSLFGGSSPPAPAEGAASSAPAGYRPSKVRLFIKPYCPWRRQAIDSLENHSVPHTVLDVISDRPAYEEMYHLSGQTLAPVIEVDGQVLADFGARELSEFWRRLARRSNPASP